MKRKDLINELKGLTIEDLRGRARSLGEELMKLRFRKASGQLEQSHRLTVLRRELARVRTFMTQKRSASASSATAK